MSDDDDKPEIERIPPIDIDPNVFLHTHQINTGCLFDGIEDWTSTNLSCPCPKCSPR